MYYIIQYLSDLFASYSYVVASKLYKINFYSTTEMFAYCNIYVLAIMLLLHPILKRKYNFNFLNFKSYIKSRTVIYATFLSVLSSYLKTVLLSNIFNISQLTLRSYAILCPFITVTLCHVFLEDQKINRYTMFSFAICLIGFFTFNLHTHFYFGFSLVMIMYTLLNGYSDYRLKSVSSKRSLEMMFFDNLMFFFISAVIFIISMINEKFTQSTFGMLKFDINKIINLQNVFPLLIIASLSFAAHNFKMLSYKVHIATIATFGVFFKSINSIAMTYLQSGIVPKYYQVLGIIIMCLGSALFLYKNYKKLDNS